MNKQKAIQIGVSILILLALAGYQLYQQSQKDRDSTQPSTRPVSAQSQKPDISTAPRPMGHPTEKPDLNAARNPTVPYNAKIGFRSKAQFDQHFQKHGSEFRGLTPAQYLTRAQQLRDAKAGGAILELRREDGVITRFDRRSGEFLACNSDLTIRTFFKPNDGEAYFKRQAARDDD